MQRLLCSLLLAPSSPTWRLGPAISSWLGSSWCAGRGACCWWRGAYAWGRPVPRGASVVYDPWNQSLFAGQRRALLDRFCGSVWWTAGSTRTIPIFTGTLGFKPSWSITWQVRSWSLDAPTMRHKLHSSATFRISVLMLGNAHLKTWEIQRHRVSMF
jgi:hypothetical protein